MDVFSREKRSQIMKRVKGQDTAPEITVRKLVFSLGYRYRLYSESLPGKPDLVFPGRKKVIFVHGCFWHGHDCRAGRNKPSSNKTYWTIKLGRNIIRDKNVQREITEMGWSFKIIWECELKDVEQLRKNIVGFLA